MPAPRSRKWHSYTVSREVNTGFNVRIREKKHECFLKLLQQRGSGRGPVPEIPESLLEAGNCVLASLWHISKKSAQAPGYTHGDVATGAPQTRRMTPVRLGVAAVPQCRHKSTE